MFLRFNASKGWSNIAGTDEEAKRPSSVVPAVTYFPSQTVYLSMEELRIAERYDCVY